MNLKIRLIVVSLFFFNVSFPQDFQSFKEIREILQVDFVKLDDTLSQKGFVFENTEGLIFKYKKNSSRLEFQTTPKEITYYFYNRGFFLKINSELVAENYQLMNSEENIIVKNKPVKAAYLKNDGENIYLWSSQDELSKKTIYVIKIQQNLVSHKPVAPIKQTAQNQDVQPLKSSGIISRTPIKQKNTPALIKTDSSMSHSKPFSFSFTLATFRYIDPDYGSQTLPNIQFGFQKSTNSKKTTSKRILSDKGYEIDLSAFLAMDYGWRSDPTDPYSSFNEYISLSKFYLGWNQYLTYNLKIIDFKFEGGPFLNYNRGVGMSGTSSFMTSGFHFGEHIQKGLGKSRNGHSKMFIGVGFDQYIAIKGGYIGSFGFNIGF